VQAGATKDLVAVGLRIICPLPSFFRTTHPVKSRFHHFQIAAEFGHEIIKLLADLVTWHCQHLPPFLAQ
jgi:hypothetical protein